jgi:flavin-dependent dehydrogenase
LIENIYDIAVIGAGPGGLSAAAHAAELGVSHVLLESSPKIANTIQKYQKGKHVMAGPGVLPLRSPMEFDAGKREAILEGWLDQLCTAVEDEDFFDPYCFADIMQSATF